MIGLLVCIGAAGATVVAAGIGAAAQGGQAIAQGKLNRKNRRWQETMYYQQQRDNLANWQRVNEYNSPEQQVQRMKEAGLNPALMYGQSAGGASGNAGSAPSSGSVGTPSSAVPQFGGIAQSAGQGIDALLKMADLQQKEVVTNNLRKQGELLQWDNLSKELGLKRDEFGFGQEKSLADYNLEVLKIKSERDRHELERRLDTAAVDWDIKALQADKVREDILVATEQRKILQTYGLPKAKLDVLEKKLRNELSSYKRDLAKQGINESDPTFIRRLAMYGKEVTMGLLGSMSLLSGMSGTINSYAKGRLGVK